MKQFSLVKILASNNSKGALWPRGRLPASRSNGDDIASPSNVGLLHGFRCLSCMHGQLRRTRNDQLERRVRFEVPAVFFDSASRDGTVCSMWSATQPTKAWHAAERFSGRGATRFTRRCMSAPATGRSASLGSALARVRATDSGSNATPRSLRTKWVTSSTRVTSKATRRVTLAKPRSVSCRRP